MKAVNTSAHQTPWIQKSLTVALLCAMASLQVASAQDAPRGPAHATARNVANATVSSDTTITDINAMLAGMPASALLAVDQQRAAIIETIINQWKPELGGDADSATRVTQVAELRSALGALRADNLLAAANARTLGGLKQIFATVDALALARASGAGQTKSVEVNSFGSLVSDAVYTPIAPCKLIDTRGTAGYTYFGGSFAAAERRSYNAYSGCGPTPANMTAILVSAITSYAGVGGGILSMMLPGAMPPLTNVFYTGYVPVTTVVPVNGASPGGLFDVQITGVSGAALIVEVIGYFAAPTPTALDCYVTPAESVSIAAGYNAYRFTTSVCATGYTAVSPYCFDGGFAGVYSSGSGVAGNAWCGWKNVGGTAATISQATQCCRVPGR